LLSRLLRGSTRDCYYTGVTAHYAFDANEVIFRWMWGAYEVLGNGNNDHESPSTLLLRSTRNESLPIPPPMNLGARTVVAIVGPVSPLLGSATFSDLSVEANKQPKQRAAAAMSFCRA
jgi:hypothetical protein